MGGEKCVLLSYKGKEREGEDPELSDERKDYIKKMTTEEGDENERMVGAKVEGAMSGSAILAHLVLDVLLMWGLSENCESGTELDVFSDVRWDKGMTLI